MTTEQKLQAIIEAQVRGGYSGYEDWLKFGAAFEISGWELYHKAILNVHESVLEILLDPQGLRAAYGSLRMSPCSCGECSCTKSRHIQAAESILDIWLFSEGDAEKTIHTAYQLLR